MAAFTGGEPTTALARRSALSSLRAPCTVQGISVLGPSPAAVLKVSNKYRYKLLIKCRNTPRLRELIARLLGEFARRREFQKVTVYADPNPDRVL